MIKLSPIPQLSDLLQLGRFSFVGLLSTALTLAIIYLLMTHGTTLLPANFLGYAAGITVNFLLNSGITFKKRVSLTSFFRFLLSCLIAYLVNLMVIVSILAFLPEKTFFSQLAGMVFYTLTNFFLNKHWAMK